MLLGPGPALLFFFGGSYLNEICSTIVLVVLVGPSPALRKGIIDPTYLNEICSTIVLDVLVGPSPALRKGIIDDITFFSGTQPCY